MVVFEQLPDQIISLAVEQMSFATKKHFSLMSKRMDALTVSCDVHDTPMRTHALAYCCL